MSELFGERPLQVSEIPDYFFSESQIQAIFGLSDRELYQLLHEIPFIKPYTLVVGGHKREVYPMSTLISIAFNRTKEDGASDKMREFVGDHLNDLLFQGFTYDMEVLGVKAHLMVKIIESVTGTPYGEIVSARSKGLKNKSKDPLDYLTTTEIRRVRGIELGLSLLHRFAGVDEGVLEDLLELK